MYLTPYTMIPAGNDSRDPLGFLRPSRTLADMVLPQFTVLTVHPTYHGFLCCAFQILHRKGISASDRGFFRAVRDLENLWGMFCVKSSHTGGLLNVMKLKKLPLQGLTLEKARKEGGLYLRLGYGALGHYVVPSGTWGFLDRQRKLTSAGEELARAWDERHAGKQKTLADTFSALAERWLKGERVPDQVQDDRSLAWSVEKGTPNEAEQTVWRKAFRRMNERIPDAKELWTSPPEDTLRALYRDSRALFFPEFRARHKNEALRLHLERCHAFEHFAALVEYVFEWEYARRIIPGASRAVPPHPDFAGAIRRAARVLFPLLEGVVDWDMPRILAKTSTYHEQVSAVIRMHITHQKRKGAQPFMDEENILLRDRISVDEVKRLAEALDGLDREAMARTVADAYPRNWFFNRVWQWLAYVGEPDGCGN